MVKLLLMGLMSFIWFPSSEGSEPIGYDVHVTNVFGQIILEEYVEEEFFSFDLEGTFRISVRSVDRLGRKSEWSEWTGFELSPQMGNVWLQIAQIAGTTQIVYVVASTQVFTQTWEDPH
jgi:hypothetical protein